MNNIQQNTQYEYCSISLSSLYSGQDYQRPVKPEAVDKLAKEWNENLLDPIVVNYRGGVYYLIDGQHRSSAARQVYGDVDVALPCRLYRGLTYKEEAELYYKLDRAKRRLSMAQSTTALIESGGDPNITDIKRIIEKNGFVWAIGASSPAAYCITSTRAVINAYYLLGSADFNKMMCISRAFGGAPRSLRADFISGMALFVKTYTNEITVGQAVRRFMYVAPEAVARRARSDGGTSRVPLKFANALWESYNAAGGVKLPYRFRR